MPQVSVILPCYNSAPYLRGAIESVLRQSFRDYELIVFDDGSADHSLELARDYERRFPQTVRCLTHPEVGHRGIAETYRAAISAARGSIVAFLEADDLWTELNLEQKVRVLEAHPGVGVVFSAYRPFGNLPGALYWSIYALLIRAGLPSRKPFDLFGQLLRRNPVASFSHFIARRELARRVPRPPATKNFDWWMLGHLSLETLFYFLPSPLTRWRIHRASAAYGGVNRITLGRLHAYLRDYYGSLLGILSGVSRKTAETKVNRLERGLRFLALISRRDRGAVLARILSHPAAFLRFLGFVLLKNLCFSSRSFARSAA